MKRSERFTRDRNAVQKFQAIFVELLGVTEREAEGLSGYFYMRVPKAGQAAEYERLRSSAALNAGAAASAARRVGLAFVIQPPRMTGQAPYQVNPIEAWDNALRPPNSLTERDVVEFATTAIGKIDELREQAEIAEHTLAGRLARIFGFAGEVRAEMATTSGGVSPSIGFWATVVAQFLGGLILVGVLGLLGVLVAHAF